MYLRKIILVAIIFLIILSIFFLSKNNKKAAVGKIRITASFYPLAEFAGQIGREKVDVINITPPGSEPHDFEPTAKDIANIYNSKVFIYNNDSFQPWVSKVLGDLSKSKNIIIDSSKNINMIDSDPHFWLDPLSAVKQIENIAEGLIQADPGNREFYQINSQIYIQKLVDLDQEFKLKLNKCSQKQIITSHAVFAYLARNYNLEAISIAGISPNEEPSPKRLAEIVDLAQRIKIKYILFETLVNPKLSETIAREIGAKTIVFNPLEGLTEEDMMMGKNYFSIQKDNLNNLLTALECQ